MNMTRHDKQCKIMNIIDAARVPGSGGSVKHYGDAATADWQVVWVDAWSNACHTVHVFHINDVWNDSDAISAAMDVYRGVLESDDDLSADDVDTALEWQLHDVTDVEMPGMRNA